MTFFLGYDANICDKSSNLHRKFNNLYTVITCIILPVFAMFYESILKIVDAR
jgi:hypothetical protein